MTQSILSRYLDPEVLGHVAERHLEPKGLVIGNLAGAHKSPLSGFAVEFAGHREYVPGDDPKHVDWRVYFTRDKYFVKQYELETNFVCHLVLDVSASMRYGEGARAKAAVRRPDGDGPGLLDHPPERQGLAVHVRRPRSRHCPAEQLDGPGRADDRASGPDRAGRENGPRPMPDRYRRPPGPPRDRDDLQRLLHRPVERLEPVLQRLRYDRHEVVLFQVMHHDELTFEFDGMVKFVGLEDADEFLAQTDDLRRGYLQAVREHSER